MKRKLKIGKENENLISAFGLIYSVGPLSLTQPAHTRRTLFHRHVGLHCRLPSLTARTCVDVVSLSCGAGLADASSCSRALPSGPTVSSATRQTCLLNRYRVGPGCQRSLQPLADFSAPGRGWLNNPPHRPPFSLGKTQTLEYKSPEGHVRFNHDHPAPDFLATVVVPLSP